MSKRRRERRAAGRKSTRQGVTRREFLKKGLLAAGGIAVGGGVAGLLWTLFSGDEIKTPYDRGYKVDSESLTEIFFDEQSTQISSEEARAVVTQGTDYIVSKKIPDPNNPNRVFTPTKVLSVEKHFQDSFLVEPDQLYTQKITELSNQALDHALNFWSSRYLEIPRTRFLLPKSREDASVKPPTNEIYTMVCYTVKSKERTIVRFDYNGRTADFERVGEESVTGHQRRNPIFRVLEREIVLESEETTPVFMALSQEPVYIAETPPVEVLHFQLQRYTNKHANEQMNKIPRNADLSVPSDPLNNSVNEWVKREEILAHAIIRLWLEEYNQYAKLGFTRAQIENKIYGPYTTESVDLSAKINGRIRDAIEAYATDPESLFVR